eukprot:m.142400 g.142400  ORF g.142400 m.142400 type:complete len:295 (+) comp24183_c1_seq2:154-1038(+)
MTDTKDLTFVTFNVLHDMMDRYSAIAELNDSSYRFEIILEDLAKTDADFIGLNEVTNNFLEMFQQTSWSSKYHLLQAGQSSHYCVLLSKLPFVSTKIIGLPNTQKKMAVGTVELAHHHRLVIAAAHFTHLQSYHAMRKVQLDHCVKELSSLGETTAVLMGDLNFHNLFEDDFIDKRHTIDCWSELKPDDPGYTYDAHINSHITRLRFWELRRMRLDRMLLINCSAYRGESTASSAPPVIKPKAIELYANEPLPPPPSGRPASSWLSYLLYPLTRLPKFQSDHFGIKGVFEVVRG